MVPPSKHTTSFRCPYNVHNVKTTSHGCQNNIVCVLGRSKTNHSVRSKNGTFLTSSPDIEEQWIGHFSELLNQPTDDDESLLVEELNTALKIQNLIKA